MYHIRDLNASIFMVEVDHVSNIRKVKTDSHEVL